MYVCVCVCVSLLDLRAFSYIIQVLLGCDEGVKDDVEHIMGSTLFQKFWVNVHIRSYGTNAHLLHTHVMCIQHPSKCMHCRHTCNTSISCPPWQNHPDTVYSVMTEAEVDVLRGSLGSTDDVN